MATSILRGDFEMGTVKDYFDDFASGWRFRYGKKTDYLHRSDVFKREIAKELRADRVETVLEIGCGAYGMLNSDSDNGIRYFACDLSFKMLQLNPWSRNIFQADFLNMPVKKRFDMVVMSSVVEWLEDPKKSPGVLSKLLMPGGVLLVSYPNSRSIVRVIEKHIVRPLKSAVRRFHYMDLQTVTDHRVMERWFWNHGFRLKRVVFFGKSIGIHGRYSSSMELDVYQYQGVTE